MSLSAHPSVEPVAASFPGGVHRVPEPKAAAAHPAHGVPGGYSSVGGGKIVGEAGGGVGRDGFHSVPIFTGQEWDAVERIPTGALLADRGGRETGFHDQVVVAGAVSGGGGLFRGEDPVRAGGRAEPCASALARGGGSAGQDGSAPVGAADASRARGGLPGHAGHAFGGGCSPAPGSKSKVRGPKSKAQGSKSKVWSPRSKVRQGFPDVGHWT